MNFDKIIHGLIVLGITTLVLLLIILSLCIALLNGVGASQGQHTGFVTSVEFNDNIVWDANIVYFKTDTESTQEDLYCVNDKQVKARLEDYARRSQKVTIQYKHPFWFFRKSCNGGSSIIYDVWGD